MGKKASFERAHQRQVQHVKERRQQKSVAAKATRRGEDMSGRLIQRTTLSKALVSDDKKAMLVKQFAQACRLPATSEDLCVLLRSVDGDQTQGNASRKRCREDALGESTLSAIVDAFLQLERQASTTMDENEEEEPMTLLEDVIQDECGGRVVCALIAALDISKHDTKKALVLDAVTKVFEENEALHEHFVACKVMRSLVRHGDSATHRRVLQVLRHHARKIDQMHAQLRNRHSAVTIQHLIEHFPTETTAWLNETLGIEEIVNEKTGKKAKCGEDDQHETLFSLIVDPVASPVVRALILNSSSPVALLKGINIVTLLESKRGCKFLQDILSPDLPKWTCEESAATLDTVLASCEANFFNMCTSSNTNFVVQAIIGLIPHTAKKSVDMYFKRLLHVLGSNLSTLATHYIGVHVVVALVNSALSLPTKEIAEEIATTLVTRNNVADMLCDPNGSLVVRKLLSFCATKNSKVGQLLTKAIEQDIISLAYDAIGNLTVQEYIKVNNGEDLACKLTKSNELLSMSQHEYASHVVGCLFDHVGAATHSGLCNALRPHVVPLSKHLNGRFVVEKAIYANRDICELLLRHFVALVGEKGTQHVLCALLMNLDQSGKQRVVDMVISGLAEFATQQCSSIVLQKLMLADALVLQAVQKELAQKPRLRNNLAQNYFGKFVVRISDTVK